MTPADCDLQDFEFMPVMVRRLLKSDTWSLGTGDERAAAIALWFESWHQVPAASLPNDDRLLKKLADSEKWKQVKEQAMRGWVLCSDGRFYHRIVAEKALEAWVEKLLNAISGAEGNAERWKIKIDVQADVERLRASAQLLRQLDPKNRAFKKKKLMTILAGVGVGSPPDPQRASPPDLPPESPPDGPATSPPDRNRQGQGQGQGQGLNTPATPTVQPGELCAALKRAGLGQCNPSDPRLLALLQRGATREHFTSLVTPALKARNPWAYLLGTVEGQINDAAQLATGPQAPTGLNGSSGGAARAARMAEARSSTSRPQGDFIDTEARDVTPGRMG